MPRIESEITLDLQATELSISTNRSPFPENPVIPEKVSYLRSVASFKQLDSQYVDVSQKSMYHMEFDLEVFEEPLLYQILSFFSYISCLDRLCIWQPKKCKQEELMTKQSLNTSVNQPKRIISLFQAECENFRIPRQKQQLSLMQIIVNALTYSLLSFWCGKLFHFNPVKLFQIIIALSFNQFHFVSKYSRYLKLSTTYLNIYQFVYLILFVLTVFGQFAFALKSHLILFGANLVFKFVVGFKKESEQKN
ncbi:Hypothetical_protein [Hexamita inflata]|uniref:Hypothetical_protein n=1 Tax=Hexamita inflata TaxID=28002 RepID=A0AA86Q4Y2_9EUKA|nr:Hypothetical protein HINF_LOCUS37373 [Hexamita inflata]